MVPKLDFTPEASEAAIAIAVAVCSSLNFITFAQAAVQPKMPMVEVGCQPLLY
jgi:hypothetical protein